MKKTAVIVTILSDDTKSHLSCCTISVSCDVYTTVLISSPPLPFCPWWWTGEWRSSTGALSQQLTLEPRAQNPLIASCKRRDGDAEFVWHFLCEVVSTRINRRFQSSLQSDNCTFICTVFYIRRLQICRLILCVHNTVKSVVEYFTFNGNLTKKKREKNIIKSIFIWVNMFSHVRKNMKKKKM